MSAKIHSYFFSILIALFFVLPASAQRENNFIYIFDCTGSMQSKHLWGPAKAALNKTIETQASIPGSQFSVIPFGDNPYKTVSFSNSDFKTNLSNLDNDFNKFIKEAKYTNISSALTSAFSRIDPNKENKIYLLTDGTPNGGDSSEKVAQTIAAFCGKHKNTRLFYVALTNGVINPTIRNAIDECKDAFIVQCENNVIPQIADISSDVYTNLEELSMPKSVSFSLPGEYNVKVISSDDLFNISVDGNKASNGKILIHLSPKGNRSTSQLHQMMQGSDYIFPIRIECTDKSYYIANPQVNIHVADKIPASLIFGNSEHEVAADAVNWYDSFLWWNAAEDKAAVWDLAPEFKNQLASSSLALKFNPADNQPFDFKAWYNDKPLSNGDIIHIIPNQPAIIKIQFNHDAEEGKRYFTLTPATVTDLNLINNQPSDDYSGTSLRTKYNVGWNPLKTILFWLVISILAAIILWFVILRRIIFPAIKLPKVEFIGPDSFYLSKRIKGARKIVLTSKKQSQNIISRLFTGEIRYVKGEIFTAEICILPVGSKKKVKLTSASQSMDNGWDFSPASIFSQYDKGEMINRATSKKTKLEFS